MNVSIGGTGYVGLVSGACFAELGHNVACVDIDKAKIARINSGISPIYEPGLEELLKKNLQNKRIHATDDWKQAIMGSDMTFICVGTPPKDDGSTDLRFIESVAHEIGKALREKSSYHVIVAKSTVPPRTSELVAQIVEKESGKKPGKDFGIAMNPEFLREGSAVHDFMNPDRIVIGAIDEKSFSEVKKLYSNFNCPLVRVNLRTAELIKYASNAFLATKVSFANEIGNVCKKLDIDAYEVMDAIGMDKRIGRAFLNAGIGWGGSCFPKDVSSMAITARNEGVEPKILSAVIEVNSAQPLKIVELAEKRLGALKGKKITVLGIAFKPDTDDIRDAPSIKIMESMIAKGAIITAYDPAAMENAKKVFGKKIKFAKSAREAIGAGDIVFILTEWKEFTDEKLYLAKKVFDGRKALDRRSGKDYEGVCW